MPRLRFGGDEGNTSAKSFHSKSLNPSNVPAMVPSLGNGGYYSMENILVG
jgi:hypothetical protein